MGKMRTENVGTLRQVAIMSNRMTSDCHARLSGIRRYLESEAADWARSSSSPRVSCPPRASAR